MRPAALGRMTRGACLGLRFYSASNGAATPAPSSAQATPAAASPSAPQPEYVKFGLKDLSIQTVQLKNAKLPPKIQPELERVLFNPGVHLVQDLRTSVKNFDAYWHALPTTEEFNFDLLNVFVTSANDKRLHALAKMADCKYVTSTSSITSIMSRIFNFVTGNKPPNLDTFSKVFSEESKDYTLYSKSPTSYLMAPHDNGLRSIVVESLDEEETVLLKVGHMMEKKITLPREDFSKLLKGAEDSTFLPQHETYHYSKAGPLLMRSQLDCYDERLPRSIFDIKSRAVMPIRMDVYNHRQHTDYELTQMLGWRQSFERERYDLIRSTMLKYHFQVRIGDMDGLFIAYHNTRKIFGFEYVTREDMDRILCDNTYFADASFNQVLQVINYMHERVLAKFAADETVRVTLAMSRNCGVVTLYAQAVDPEAKDPLAHVDKNFAWELRCVSFLNGVQVDKLVLTEEKQEEWTLYLKMIEKRFSQKEFDMIRESMVIRASQRVSAPLPYPEETQPGAAPQAA